MFNEAPDAVSVNGRPLYAANTPFSCQPPRMVFAAPSVAHDLPAPNGSSYTKASWKLCGISCDASARFRSNTLAAFQLNSVQSEYVASSIAFENVYALLISKPSLNRRLRVS